MDASQMYCVGQEAYPEPSFSHVRDVYREYDFHENGLINRGNSCYINALVQCLAKATPLSLALRRLREGGRGEHKCRRQAAKGSAVAGVCSLCTVQYASVAEHADEVVGALARGVDQVSSVLHPRRQEDVHEFYRLLLDDIHLSLYEYHLATTGKPRSSGLEMTTLPNKIFAGWLQSAIKCCTCGAVSKVYQPYLDVSVRISGTIATLQDALADFTRPDTLAGAYDCGSCKRAKQDAEKILKLHTVPCTLVIQFQRFVHTGTGVVKHDKMIQYPYELDLAPYVDNECPVTPMAYRLSAIIMHQGRTANSGHYTCALSHRGRWVHYNDETVTPVKKPDVVLGQRPYLLLYTRKDVAQMLAPGAPPAPTAPPPLPASPRPMGSPANGHGVPLRPRPVRHPQPVTRGTGVVKSSLGGPAAGGRRREPPRPRQAPPLELFKKTTPQLHPSATPPATPQKRTRLLMEGEGAGEGTGAHAATTPPAAPLESASKKPRRDVPAAQRAAELPIASTAAPPPGSVATNAVRITRYYPLLCTNCAPISEVSLAEGERLLQRAVAAEVGPGVEVAVRTLLEKKAREGGVTEMKMQRVTYPARMTGPANALDGIVAKTLTINDETSPAYGARFMMCKDTPGFSKMWQDHMSAVDVAKLHRVPLRRRDGEEEREVRALPTGRHRPHAPPKSFDAIISVAKEVINKRGRSFGGDETVHDVLGCIAELTSRGVEWLEQQAPAIPSVQAFLDAWRVGREAVEALVDRVLALLADEGFLSMLRTQTRAGTPRKSVEPVAAGALPRLDALSQISMEMSDDVPDGEGGAGNGAPTVATPQRAASDHDYDPSQDFARDDDDDVGGVQVALWPQSQSSSGESGAVNGVGVHGNGNGGIARGGEEAAGVVEGSLFSFEEARADAAAAPPGALSAAPAADAAPSANGVGVGGVNGVGPAVGSEPDENHDSIGITREAPLEATASGSREHMDGLHRQRSAEVVARARALLNRRDGLSAAAATRIGRVLECTSREIAWLARPQHSPGKRSAGVAFIDDLRAPGGDVVQLAKQLELVVLTYADVVVAPDRVR